MKVNNKSEFTLNGYIYYVTKQSQPKRILLNHRKKDAFNITWNEYKDAKVKWNNIFID